MRPLVGLGEVGVVLVFGGLGGWWVVVVVVVVWTLLCCMYQLIPR